MRLDRMEWNGLRARPGSALHYRGTSCNAGLKAVSCPNGGMFPTAEGGVFCFTGSSIAITSTPCLRGPSGKAMVVPHVRSAAARGMHVAVQARPRPTFDTDKARPKQIVLW